MKMQDHYQTLGVQRGATDDEIKKAYRKQAAKHHPDRGGDKAEFQKIEEAYRTLSDPQTRAQYDNPNPFGGDMGGFSFNFNQNPFDINDLFAQAFGGGARRTGPRQMTQYRTQIWVTLEQVYAGSEHSLHLGNSNEIYKINIPQGIDDGQTVRYDNLIPNAILLVEFRVHQHKIYRRKNLDIYSTEKVNVLRLIAGTSVKVTTIGGQTLDVNIPASTQPGVTLRLSNQGLIQNGHQGDHYVLLETEIPVTLSEQFINAVKQELGNQ
jgi:curved DNA-binding protein